MKNLFTLLFISLFSTFLAAQTVSIGGTNYANITAAIAAASAGDVIDITGVHTERVTLNKAVTLRGTDPSTDVIEAHANPGSASGRTLWIQNIGAGSVTIENLTIRHGNANGGNGGGVFIDKVTGMATFNHCIIENNQTSRNGAGASFLGSNVTMNYCTVRNNTTTSVVNARGNGAGLHIVSANAAGINATTVVNNSTINNNSAARNGGAFHLNGNNNNGDQYILNVEFNNTTIALNVAGTIANAPAGRGGIGQAMAADVVAGGGNPVGAGNINLTMNHVTAARNTANPGDNFGLTFSDGGSTGATFNLYNSIMVSAGTISNRAINFDQSNTVNVINNIVGGQIFMNMISGANVNNVWGRTAGQAGIPNNLSNDGGDVDVFPLNAGSLPIDHVTAPTGLVPTGLDARGFVRSGTADAGAYEFGAVAPAVPVPTMGEWAVFILFLLMVNIAGVFMLGSQNRLAVATKTTEISMGTVMRSVPFHKVSFFNAMPHAFGLAFAGFAFIFLFWGEIVAADFIGMAISIPLVAYFIHLFVKKEG